MKKKKGIFEEDEDDGAWFANDEIETMEVVEAMTGFLKVQHAGALELTKLTLEYCKIENLSKENVFTIFQDAMILMQKNTKSPIQ